MFFFPFPTSAWQELKDLCKQHGRVIRADMERGTTTGTAVFETTQGAEEVARALHGAEVDGLMIVRAAGPALMPLPRGCPAV